MGVRQDFVREMVALFGEKQFRYGAYKSQPKTPYGMYMRPDSDNVMADNKVYYKVDNYELRVVTDEKDFALEQKVEAILDKLETPYNVILEEDITSEKVHVIEWDVQFYG